MTIIRPSWIFVGWLLGVFATLGACALDFSAIRNRADAGAPYKSGFIDHYVNFWADSTIVTPTDLDRFDPCFDQNGKVFYSTPPLKTDGTDKATSR